MIRAHFVTDEEGFIRAVSLKGHADFTDEGNDPLCAAVTGMVTLVANTLTEVLRLDCEIKAEEDGEFSLRVPHSARESAKVTLLGLKVQLQDYQVQYPENLRVTVQD